MKKAREFKRRMPTLAHLLSVHDRFKPDHSLPDNVGDGYLIARNPLYRNIRLGALAAGYRFSPQRFHDYDISSLSQLPRILAEKTIPYRDNVSTLREMLSKCARAPRWNELMFPSKNYLFHESCHGIARQATRDWIPARLRENRLAGERRKALGILLEESYANCCEQLLVNSCDSDSGMEAIFVDKNSYIAFGEHQQFERIRAARERLEPKLVFMVTYLSYVYSNFLYKVLGRGELERVLDFARDCAGIAVPARPALKQRADLLLLFREGIKLNQLFRLGTARFYFNFVGLRTQLFRLLDFDFMSTLEKDRGYVECLHSLSETARNEPVHATHAKAA